MKISTHQTGNFNVVIWALKSFELDTKNNCYSALISSTTSFVATTLH